MSPWNSPHRTSSQGGNETLRPPGLPGLDRHRDRRRTHCLRFMPRVGTVLGSLLGQGIDESTRFTQYLALAILFFAPLLASWTGHRSSRSRYLPGDRLPSTSRVGSGSADQFRLHLFSELGKSKFSPTTRSRTAGLADRATSEHVGGSQFPSRSDIADPAFTAHGMALSREPGVQTTVGRPDGEVGLMRETRP